MSPLKERSETGTRPGQTALVEERAPAGASTQEGSQDNTKDVYVALRHQVWLLNLELGFV
jgi:hypothetical protein